MGAAEAGVVAQVADALEQLLREGGARPALDLVKGQERLRQPGRAEARGRQQGLEQRCERPVACSLREPFRVDAEGARPRASERELADPLEDLRGLRLPPRRPPRPFAEIGRARAPGSLRSSATQRAEHPRRRARGGHELGEPAGVAGRAREGAQLVGARRGDPEDAVADGRRTSEAGRSRRRRAAARAGPAPRRARCRLRRVGRDPQRRGAGSEAMVSQPGCSGRRSVRAASARRGGVLGRERRVGDRPLDADLRIVPGDRRGRLAGS